MVAKTLVDIYDFEITTGEENAVVIYYMKERAEDITAHSLKIEKLVKLAEENDILVLKWICNNYEGGSNEKALDYLSSAFGIGDEMGVIFFRDGDYLTCITGIRENWNKRIETYQKVLAGFDEWPVQKTPKERKAAEAARLAAAKAKSNNCCTVL